ncbi:hypothetical protein EG359_04890 [Chryseobacterium joostei]|uniref:DUF6705 domain-containing protein n=1 Tax=Chryseobacterium joostei TaxID=112234 RepID=A0A1N7HV92_9FLAO|nr:DUF6705 family protein [Chryseobacterium joostei]AZA98980.1 hypothetical protein EG359_04890 [Chryseobacterium joostei]SIS28774.1 hypothetical protein SAMN05421768_101383 [Chryseobacterium joostei]
MKNIFFIICFFVGTFYNAQQIYSLRPTEISLDANSYEKDTNNELPFYEGTWKGNWNNKTIFITFTKLTHKYDPKFNRYRDYLVGKFKVINSNGNVIFDNTNFTDDNSKIKGVSFRKYGDKYSLSYIDSDLCDITGGIAINFTDSSKTQLNWKLNYGSNMITNECPYYNTQIPEALPKTIILTKQ